MAPRWQRALVTGASSGIGAAIVEQLASDGTHLVLVARDVARLDATARRLRNELGIEVDVLPADLADAEQRATVEARLAAEPPIDLLVNNAGFGTYGTFAELDVDEEVREIEVNVLTVVRLTRAVLPSLIARGEGTVLNVSSIASLQPVPRNATYGATKAFVTSFSEAVHAELRGTGVTLTAALPGFTHTEFQERAGLGDTAGLPEVMWQSAADCAAEALAGAAAGKAVVVTGTLNKVIAATSAPLPRGVKRRTVALLSGRFGR